MIGFITDPENEAVVDLIRRAAEIAAPNAELVILDQEKSSHFRAMDASDFTREIMCMDACIIDLECQSVNLYGGELGSLAAGINCWAGHERGDHEIISSLDSRVLLLTRKPLFESKESTYFRDYYSIMTLAEGTSSKQVKTLSQWLGETLGKARARVFISYRSAMELFAHKVAASLRRRGAAVWLDEIDLNIEETIPAAISRGLGWCTHVVMCADETLFESEWTKAEYESFLHRYMTETRHFRRYQRERVLIPLFMVDPSAEDLPSMLRQIRGIDCRNISFQKSMNQLWTVISSIGQR